MAYLDNVTNILQIQPDGLPTYVRLSQNENGRNLYFELQGNEIDIPSNATVTISGTKPDGTVYSGTGSVTDNVVLIPEMLQMTAVAGTWDAKIQITSGGNTIATGRVRFVVDADTVAPGSVPSDSELEGLVAQAQQYAETARTEAYGSPLTASTAASMTDHTRVYVYTGSESGYTAGHWYFWNGSAWTDGGIYNSVAVNTDPTLKLSGVAADAKATGDAIAAVTIETDKTLSVSDAPADAKVVGDEITSLKGDLSDMQEKIDEFSGGLTPAIKDALLNCFANVAWVGDDGQDYYDALASALNESPFPKINVVYSPGTHIVYDDDALDSLKPYITLTYYETAASTGAVIASTDYTLSGTLTEGISTITATYNNLSKAFSVTVISGRQLPTVYTWLYDATDGELLSEQSYITKTTGGDGGSETIVNNQLLLNVLPTTNESITNFLRFSFSDTSTTSGKMSARVKFHHVTKSLVESTGASGFRMQLSNGTAGAQVFFCSQPYSNQNLGISYFTGTTRIYVDLSAYDITEYHIVEIELKNGRQIISIDGDEIVNVGTLSTNYCTANAILNQAGSEASAPNGCVTEIDWIAYYEE